MTEPTIRPATRDDREAVAGFAGELAHRYVQDRERFDVSYATLLESDGACLLVAVDGEERLGYLLGFSHFTFHANGPIGWVEEILVRPTVRGRGVGRALMTAFEEWAARRDCAVVALSTRRAAPFYLALGYADSATYFRKELAESASS